MSALACPQNVLCRNVGNGSIELSFDPVTDAVSYNAYVFTSLPAGLNLLAAPEDFSSAAWDRPNSYAMGFKNESRDPLGGMKASRIQINQGGAIQQTITSADASYAFSVYLKAGTFNSIELEVTAAEDTPYTLSILSGPGTVDDYAIRGLSQTQWTRVQFVFDFDAEETNGNLLVGLRSLHPVYGGSIYAWGAKLEVGTAATTYEPWPRPVNRSPILNTTAKIANIPFGTTVYVRVTAVDADGVESAMSALALDATCGYGVTTIQFEGIVGDTIPAGAVFTARVGSALVSFVTTTGGVCS